MRSVFLFILAIPVAALVGGAAGYMAHTPAQSTEIRQPTPQQIDTAVQHAQQQAPQRHRLRRHRAADDTRSEQEMSQSILLWRETIIQLRPDCAAGDNDACERIRGFEQSLREEGAPIPPQDAEE